MGVNEYCEFDYSLEGSCADSLMQGLPIESNQSRIMLSDRVEKRPPNLTPEMATWFDAYVSSRRAGALDEVQQVLDRMDPSKHGTGVFAEREIWRVQKEELEAKRKHEREERDAHQKDYIDLDELTAERLSVRARYEKKRTLYGREPKSVNLAVYGAVLFFFGITDIALNWEHIYKAELGSPIIAFGVSTGIAVLIALSAHLTGTTLKQFKARFGRDRDDLDLWAGSYMLGLASLGLSVAMSVVFFIRWRYFGIQISESLLLNLEPPDLIGTVIGSMLTNLGVWIAGIIIAFLLHDPDPAYPQAKEALERVEHAIDRTQRMLNRKLTRKFEQSSAKAKKAIEGIRAREVAMAGLPEQKEARRLIEKIRAQDAHVLALLGRYRSRLVQVLPTDSSPFLRPGDLAFERVEELSGAQYSGIGMEMNYD